jgi:hypothetical protein
MLQHSATCQVHLFTGNMQAEFRPTLVVSGSRLSNLQQSKFLLSSCLLQKINSCPFYYIAECTTDAAR